MSDFYPGSTENDEQTIDESKLDAAIARRDQLEGQLDQLKADGDGYTVLGQFFPNVSIERLRDMRGAELDRICTDLDRLDKAITALMLEAEPVDSIEGWDDEMAA